MRNWVDVINYAYELTRLQLSSGIVIRNALLLFIRREKFRMLSENLSPFRTHSTPFSAFGIDVIHSCLYIHSDCRASGCKAPSWIIVKETEKEKNGKLTVMKIAACLLSNSDGQKSSGSARVGTSRHGNGSSNSSSHYMMAMTQTHSTGKTTKYQFIYISIINQFLFVDPIRPFNSD